MNFLFITETDDDDGFAEDVDARINHSIILRSLWRRRRPRRRLRGFLLAHELGLAERERDVPVPDHVLEGK